MNNLNQRIESLSIKPLPVFEQVQTAVDELYTALAVVFNRNEEIRLERRVRRLRMQLAAFGVDTSHLSDEEIIERVEKTAEMLASTGTSVKETADAPTAVGWRFD